MAQCEEIFCVRKRSIMEKEEQLKEALFQILSEKGAKLMGVADLSGIVEGAMQTGISVAVPVPVNIVNDLKEAPTEEYYHMYHQLNAQLNEIVEAGADFLQKKGYQAQANTTAVMEQDENWCTWLPHKTVATRAGLGWIGKSCLLVTREYGGAVRISSLITDAPLEEDTPVDKSLCGDCTECVKHCPAGALKGELWKAGMERAELFDKDVCFTSMVIRMKALTGIEADLCGKCFAVCPYTQRYLKGK